MNRQIVVWRSLLLVSGALSSACTIFDGLTPPGSPPDAAADGAADARSDVAADVDGGPVCDEAGLCASGQGLCAPQSLCSDASPCAKAVVVSPDGGTTTQSIASAITLPSCMTQGSVTPSYDDHLSRMTWTLGAAPRAACVYQPPGSGKKPLVVFLHRLGGSADDIYNLTTLRSAATSYPLGDGSGFAIAADQGDNLESAAHVSSPGAAHDFYYRDFGSNPDFQSLDHIIDTLVAGERIDTQRIYLIGWGEGGFFAEEYAIVRNVTATPGGNRVAAAAVYESADPFQGPSTSFADCKEAKYPTSAVGLYLLQRACGFCNAPQMTMFGLPPGYDAEDWVTTLKDSVKVDPVELIIDELEKEASSCASVCSAKLASSQANTSWPLARETGLLSFLASHTL
jgi:pimeloyl-ACP methyl ester carboxylesterase